jgi:predicted GIY-YIG superfamily endonuclease
MSLSLPEDIEPFLTDANDWSDSAVYALELSRPDDLADAWDKVYDHRPDYWDELTEASSVCYVGAAKSLISRLEDHRNQDVRKTVLTAVCSIESLSDVWWCKNMDEAIQYESKRAIELQNERPEDYIHSR